MAQSRSADRCAAGWRSRCTQPAAPRLPASFGRSRRSSSPTTQTGDVATVKEIAAQTGLSVQTVRRRLRLRSLTPALRAPFEQRRIIASVAETAARLPEPEQKRLADELAQRGRLTLPSVRHLVRERSVEAKAELPDELFADRELPWQATVCGHITAALSALPADNCPRQLAALLKRALAETERA